MYINLDPKMSLADVNAAFQNYFGLLKLEFFSETHEPGELSDEKSTLDLTTTLNEIGISEPTRLEFNKDTKVAEFEELFRRLGIGVQVLRKSKELWLHTSSTDSWSLQEQQLRALEMSGTPEDNSEPIDYHEQE
jgi:hypothetical protein